MMSGCSSSEKKKMAGTFSRLGDMGEEHGAKERRNVKDGASITFSI
jgi:hypothetical protein